MALLRFNIDTCFNKISSSLGTFFRSITSTTVKTTGVIHRYTVSGKSECSAIASSSTSKICWASGTSTCVVEATAIPVTILVSSGVPVECSATVTCDCIAKSVCRCICTSQATSNVIQYSSSTVRVNAYCASRAYSPNDVTIAAFDSSYEDKMFADYVCTGINDERTINSAIFGTRGRSGMRLRFARGTYYINESIAIKDINILGAGPGQTVFVFAQLTVRNITVRTTSTTTVDGFSITGSGTLKVIYDNPLAVNDTIEILNVHATDYVGDVMYNNNTLGKINVEIAYPVSTITPTSIPNHHLIIENCKVWDVDYSGFYIYGDTNNDVLLRMLKSIKIRNCHATRCGKRDNGTVVAGFNLLHNVSVEDIKITNSIATDNWHCGFYFDDARIRAYTVNNKNMSRVANKSNVVYNLYMDNCKAIGNGKRSQNRTLDSLLPFCSGFVLREFSSGSSSVDAIPQFVTIYEGIPYVVPQSPPEHPGDLTGPCSSDDINVSYGNLVNCIATNNTYAGFYSRGYNWNDGELNITNCYATGSEYAVALDGHDGIKIHNMVSSAIDGPSVILNNINTIGIKYMRIEHGREAQYITFNTIDEYNNLSVVDRRFCEVNGVI